MSDRTYYEAHVTLIGRPAAVEPLVRAARWKFSHIEGDEVFGAGLKCYATRQFKSSIPREHILNELQGVADRLVEQGCTVVRRKIELVLYDDRSSAIRFTCDGACPECHTEAA